MEAAYHRKIELQSPEDFAYLARNVQRAAAESVAAAFPPVEDARDKTGGSKARAKGRKKGASNDDDDLHTRVEELVDEYIRRTYALAAPNLTINGLPVDPDPYFGGHDDHGGEEEEEEEEVYEPFDGRKRQRVEDLAREEEDLLRDIAALKRRVPPAAVRVHAHRLESAVAADTAAADAAMAAAAAAAAEAEAELWAKEEEAAASAAAARRDGGTAANSFAQAVAGLGRLKQAMPATVARMERARVAGEYAAAER